MDIIDIVTVIGVILVSMTLHEVMHGFTAYALGDDTAKLLGRLSFNPIKHIDPFLTIILPVLLTISGGPIFGGAKPVPFNPSRVKWDEWGSALVAIAGPLTNLVLAFVAFGVGVLTGVVTEGGILATTYGQVVYLFIVVNLGFFAFNMIPLPPLDGSRVLYALAPDFVRRGMDIIERFGVMFVFLIVIVASPLLFAFMGAAIEFFFGIFAAIFGV